MSFAVLLHPRAARSLKKLHSSIRSRILESVKELERTPDKGDQMKPSQFRRLRVGDYRVIYEIDMQSKRVIELYMGHRKNVYDDFTRLF
ncbi:MAG: type II toxin-antitoxin system RelE/ParE family toxin [Thaumarchaeota archaeon]|nr:MAG: type II toxin-antitoxin system RelE/ParE family toxin [Nitrososphaerota archaeon]TLY14865.1 MAG: type II toxin-antitoxin system RelE/ParE family toxin [Nitrososphaerota archaeon]